MAGCMQPSKQLFMESDSDLQAFEEIPRGFLHKFDSHLHFALFLKHQQGHAQLTENQ